jgi:uncharacterized protein
MIPRGAKWRVAVVAALTVVPVVFLCGVGAYHLYQIGWAFVTWGVTAGCFLLAYLLGWYWTRQGSYGILPKPNYDDPLPYWTDRDRSAWQLVEKHATESKPLQMDDLSDPTAITRYAAEGQELALKLAQVYRPGTADPFGHLTLPEILAVVELAAHDLNRRVDAYVPGSHLLTLRHFKQAKQASEWYETGRNVYWLASAFFNPLKAAAQVVTTKAGLQSAFNQIQKNVLHWFYLSFVHELGRYLIELHSGRLKVGATRYRELMAQHQVPPVLTEEDVAKAANAVADDGPAAEQTQAASRVTVAIVGPVKAGKSSLINAALGAQRAAVDVVPLTAATTRYELNQAGLPPLAFLDTIGFGLSGPVEADIRNAVDAVQRADVVVLAVPARSAARAPEVEFLDRIRAAFVARPELRMPPVIVALTQIDHLSPAMEWAPPYDWRTGTRPKEQTIRDAVAAGKELFGEKVADVLPVCGADGKVFNVREELMPEIAERLGEARGVSLLRALHIDSAVHRTKKVMGQVLNVGREVLKAVMKGK